MATDKIDIRILRKVQEMSVSQAKDIIEALTDLRCPSVLRRRLDALDIQGLIVQDRKSEKGKVFCYITPFGEKTLAGREENSSSSEESP